MKTIDGRTKLAGVIGNPLWHTLSPAMHNAVYERQGLNWVYVPMEIKDEIGLRRFMALAPELNLVGFNVTMPFKTAVLELCDEVAMAATMAGAVNTVHVVDGRLVGYNTDGRGMIEALEIEAGFIPTGKKVALLGAGGAAAAAFIALQLARVESISIVSRNTAHGEELLDRMRPHLGAMRAQAYSPASAEQVIRDADLVINATPLGMNANDPSPVDVSWLRPGQVVLDMVYGTPVATKLFIGASAAGAVVLDGVGMLVCQGATAIDIWNDSKQSRTPREVMRAAASAALASRLQASGAGDGWG